MMYGACRCQAHPTLISPTPTPTNLLCILVKSVFRIFMCRQLFAGHHYTDHVVHPGHASLLHAIKCHILDKLLISWAWQFCLLSAPCCVCTMVACALHQHCTPSWRLPSWGLPRSIGRDRRIMCCVKIFKGRRAQFRVNSPCNFEDLEWASMCARHPFEVFTHSSAETSV